MPAKQVMKPLLLIVRPRMDDTVHEVYVVNPQRSSFAICFIFAVGVSPLLPPSSQAMGKDLNAHVNALAKAQLAKMGDGYVAQIDRRRHIVYISALDDEHLRRTQLLLASFTDAQRVTLFDKPLPWNLTVVLPTIGDYEKLAAKAKVEHASGFFTPALQRLVSIDRGKVLIHEFTHALHQADMTAARQVHPVWITEGLATLFETSEITPAGVIPAIDTRVLTLKRALRQDKLIGLDELLQMNRKRFMERPDVAYAQSRYLMFYLWHKQRLKRFYTAYKSGYHSNTTGKKALETALGSRLFLIEPKWRQWVETLKIPANYARGTRGRLGLEVKDHPRGVKVVSLLHGGAAKRTGRIRVGDIIEGFNSIKVTNPAQFFAVVRAAGSMKTATIHVIRHNRRIAVSQPLGADPKR